MAAAPLPVDPTDRAKEAWNHYLDGDRDRAPGDYIAEWLHRQAKQGLDIANHYAHVAKERVGVLTAGKDFLDAGGPAAQTPILAKKIACNAVTQDASLSQHLAHLARLNAQEASFCTDATRHERFENAHQLYAHAAELLEGGAPLPVAPTWGSDMERDAGMIMQFRMAKADLYKVVGLAGDTPSRAEAKARKEPSREELIRELFRLHDLNANGVLEEEELIKLNEKVHLLHYGKDADLTEVRSKYKALFRSRLDKRGQPVPFESFDKYIRHMIEELDKDPRAQVMILEQWIAEAESAREAFRFKSLSSISDAPYLPHLGTGGQESSPSSAVPAAADGSAASGGRAHASGRGGYAAAALAAGVPPATAFGKGEKVQVWSNSKKAWLDGVVQESYEVDTWSHGYAVPAGTIKVSSKVGTKWIMPKQAAEVRKMPS